MNGQAVVSWLLRRGTASISRTPMPTTASEKMLGKAPGLPADMVFLDDQATNIRGAEAMITPASSGHLAVGMLLGRVYAADDIRGWHRFCSWLSQGWFAGAPGRTSTPVPQPDPAAAIVRLRTG